MYQPFMVNIFISEFAVSILLLMIGGFWLKYRRKNIQSNSESKIPICKDPLCKKLEPLMKNLIVKRLEFKDDTEEVQKIIEHMERMKQEVHTNDSGFLSATFYLF